MGFAAFLTRKILAMPGPQHLGLMSHSIPAAAWLKVIDVVNRLNMAVDYRGRQTSNGHHEDQPPRLLRAAFTHALNATATSYPTTQPLTAAQPKLTGSERR
jgi:hypothetical protein